MIDHIADGNALHYWLGKALPNYFQIVFPEPVYVTKVRTFNVAASGRYMDSNLYYQAMDNGLYYVGTVGRDGTPAVSDYVDIYINQWVQQVYYDPIAKGTYAAMGEIEIYRESNPAAAISVNNPSFGNVRVGTTGTATLTVTNTGFTGTTLTGSFGPASGSEFAPGSGNQDYSLSSGISASRNYTYTPTERGTDSTSVTVASNVGNVSRTISGTGVSPVLGSSLAPNAALDFGTIETTSTQSITLQNITPDADLGDLTDLTLLNATISGPDADYFSLVNFTPGMVLGKLDSTNLNILFSNLYHGEGPKTATLTLTTDENAALGVAGKTYQFQLTATAIPEPYSFALLALACSFYLALRKKE